MRENDKEWKRERDVRITAQSSKSPPNPLSVVFLLFSFHCSIPIPLSLYSPSCTLLKRHEIHHRLVYIYTLSTSIYICMQYLYTYIPFTCLFHFSPCPSSFDYKLFPFYIFISIFFPAIFAFSHQPLAPLNNLTLIVLTPTIDDIVKILTINTNHLT